MKNIHQTRVSVQTTLVIFLCLLCPGLIRAQSTDKFRPPAVPLVTHDPYFSIWSMNDNLTDDRTKHWTGARHGLYSMARIDGKAYRLMGPRSDQSVPMRQIGLDVTPTRTIYRFEADGVEISLTFLSPLLPSRLDVLARPLTYITWEVRAIDAKPHQVAVYFDCSSEIAANTNFDQMIWKRHQVAGLRVLSTGTKNQPMLEKSGDDLRIDWGYLYLAIPSPDAASETDAIVSQSVARNAFSSNKMLPDTDDLRMPRAVRDETPVLATAINFGEVGSTPVSRFVMLAYDDQFSVEYLQRRLRPYWRRGKFEIAALLMQAAKDYPDLVASCGKFDQELMTDLRSVGGEEYARLSALAFRQAIAAHKLTADFDGSPLFFSKENFSNGSIDTVDITYPSAPMFLLFNPDLLKAQLTPLLDYARSGRWPWPYAPHDLGTYPLANGQTYGGGETSEENQMPVEESGNILLLMAGIAQAEGNADYAKQYWPLLTKWAEYLREKGLDPESQLSTDDFAGHLAHNTNLSIKAILALGSYARLCEMLNHRSEAATYRRMAEAMVKRWVEMANDTDHYRLAFDKPGTWSQKYNLVWDKLLGLNLFPTDVARREIAFYKTKQNAYGLPLDNRESYTKLDWIVWTATLAESPDDFQLFIRPVYKFLNESSSRVPMTDWYGTVDAKQKGFQARAVVGGVFIKMLADARLWKKWNGYAKQK